MNATLLYAGSIVAIAWGIAHIGPTRSAVEGFGAISIDSRRIITMEWVVEGLALCFIGTLTLLTTLVTTGPDPVATLVYRVSAAMLLVMAGWTSVTGSRTSSIAFKICPLIKATAAILLFLGSLGGR